MKSPDDVLKELKERNFTPLCPYQGCQNEIPLQCDICLFNFLRKPTKNIKCSVCNLDHKKKCERWTAKILTDLRKANYPFIVTFQKREVITNQGHSFTIIYDFVIYSPTDIYLKHPILYIEVMEKQHFFYPNGRSDSKSKDNEVTFKYRRSDYHKWGNGYIHLVPILIINEHEHIKNNDIKFISQKIKKAFEISKIKCTTTKRVEIIKFFSFPAPKMVPTPEYNEKELGFFPWEGMALCNDYNYSQPINWDVYCRFY